MPYGKLHSRQYSENTNGILRWVFFVQKYGLEGDEVKALGNIVLSYKTSPMFFWYHLGSNETQAKN